MGLSLVLTERKFDSIPLFKEKNLYQAGNFGTLTNDISDISSFYASNDNFNGQFTPYLFSNFGGNSIGTHPVLGHKFVLPTKNCFDQVAAFIGDGNNPPNFPIIDTLQLDFQPNTKYYLNAYVFISWGNEQVFNFVTQIHEYNILFELNGLTDATIEHTNIFSLSRKDSVNVWHPISACLTTGNDIVGSIQLSKDGIFSNLFDPDPLYVDYLTVTKEPFQKTNCYSRSTSKNLQLLPNINTKITYKARDIKKPDFFFQTSITKEVSFYLDSVAKECLGNLRDVNSIKGRKSLCSKFEAKIFNKGKQLLDGVFYIKDVSYSKKSLPIIKASINGENKSWSALLDDLTLGDIDWSEYNHIRNFNTVESSWNADCEKDFFVYALFEERTGYTPNGNIYNIELQRLRPHLFVKPFLRKIFKHICYDVEFKGETLNSDCFCKLALYVHRYYLPWSYYDGRYSPNASDYSGMNINMNDEIFPYNIKDIIKSIANAYNIIPLTNNTTNTICLISANDWIYSKPPVNPYRFKQDWSSRVNHKKLSNTKSCIEFLYCEDSNDEWFEGSQRNPDNSDLLFGNDKIVFDESRPNNCTTIELAFAATRRYVMENGMIIPKAEISYDEDDLPTDFNDDLVHPIWKPRMFIWNGLQPIPNGVMQIRNNGGAGISALDETRAYSEYPQLQFYSEEENGCNLAFHDYGNGSVTNQGLVNKHWNNEIQAFRNSLVASGYFYIPYNQIGNIDFSRLLCDEDGNLFYINCLKDTDPQKEVSTKIELISYNQFFDNRF